MPADVQKTIAVPLHMCSGFPALILEQMEREEEEGELAYEAHSPYYSPIHLPEIYEDE